MTRPTALRVLHGLVIAVAVLGVVVPPFYALVTLYTICDSGCPVPIGGEGLTLAVGVLAGPVALLGAGLWTLATGRGRQVWGYWVFLAEVLGIVVIILLNP